MPFIKKLGAGTLPDEIEIVRRFSNWRRRAYLTINTQFSWITASVFWLEITASVGKRRVGRIKSSRISSQTIVKATGSVRNLMACGVYYLSWRMAQPMSKRRTSLVVTLYQHDLTWQWVSKIDRKNVYRRIRGLYFPNYKDSTLLTPANKTLIDGELVIDHDKKSGEVSRAYQ